MKETRHIMGMPITVEVVDSTDPSALAAVFDYFTYVDKTFSTYKEASEITRINRGELQPPEYSKDMQEVLRLTEQTKQETNGYFDIRTPSGALDPSGLVKGWSIYRAAQLLEQRGIHNYFIDAGGDIEVSRPDEQSGKAVEPWRIGIQNPFNNQEIVKAVALRKGGLATSGSYMRGHHIYNPHSGEPPLSVMSLTVIGPNIYEADRFATAAFAMGEDGIYFIEQQPGLEGYQINNQGIATATTGFSNYSIQ